VAITRSSRIALALAAAVVWVVFVAQFAPSPAERAAADAEAGRSRAERRIERIDEDLTPSEPLPASKDGIAALVMMDVSGSMADPVEKGGPAKIEIAKRSALALIQQFATYAAAHPEEPVQVGLYEFSDASGDNTREIIGLSQADPDVAEAALARLRARGGTPIGDAVVEGKRVLDRSGLTKRHLLVVTDGENTDGHEPEDVMAAIARRPPEERPSVYFVAFDIAASRFDRVRDAGGLVLAAGNEQELNDTLSSLLTGKILVEGR
jgi:Mg-chelatase subunit ChlD